MSKTEFQKSETELQIEEIIPGGLGLGHHEGRAVFVPFTAPGDRIRVALLEKRRRHYRGRCLEVLEPGPLRVEPFCSHYETCGGCHLQHLSIEGQGEVKRGFVADSLRRLGKIDPEGILGEWIPAPSDKGYRRRAGLKVRWVKDKPLVGFFAPASHRVVDLSECPILHPKLAEFIPALRDFIPHLKVRERLPHVDVVSGENGPALVFHILSNPHGRDKDMMTGFAREHGAQQVWIQRKGKENLEEVWRGGGLTYQVDELTMRFDPGDFIQANFEQNRRLVAESMALAGSGEAAWDLFCGVGNFTLPLAKRFSRVRGIDSYGPGLRRAKTNARKNSLDSVRFRKGNLSIEEEIPQSSGGMEILLLDPPREGAVELVKKMPGLNPRQVIYVSCNPATFARDAAIMEDNGFKLETVIPIDLFPNTHHLELVARFINQREPIPKKEVAEITAEPPNQEGEMGEAGEEAKVEEIKVEEVKEESPGEIER
ncbi:MAG: 23S rRNA (uracil(1939)-C(5))-methyltransferase RlmD [Magnetococcales bacterium]|nr:23S rRNA (uracil(1939)-C(5))-methyltransferase RlmD [Magnetococcales bacterium]